MDIKRAVQIYIIALIWFLIIDGTWLYFASGFYSNQLGDLLASEVNFLAAAAFYILYLVGLTYFVLLPNRALPATFETALKGGFFTFIAYATYDLTNLATIADWPYVVSLVDMAWSVILGSSVTFLTLMVFQKLRFR